MRNVRISRYSILLLSSLFGWNAYATPASFIYQGQIIKSNGQPLNGNPTTFTVQIISPGTEACVLYEEKHMLNMSNSEGVFSLAVGTGSRTGSDFEDSSSVVNVFKNNITFPSVTHCADNSGAYAPSSLNDRRKLRLTYNDGTGDVLLASDHNIQSVPFAWDAKTIDGLAPSNFVQINSVANITQLKLESLFTGSNYATLLGLADGSTPVVTSSANGAAIPSFATDPVSPPAGSMWVNTTTNEMKYNSGSGIQVVGAGGGGSGDITGVTTSTGSGLSGGAASGTPVLQVVVDNSTVEIATNTIQVKDGGITDAKIATVAVDKITSSAGKYFSYMPNATECADNGILRWDATNDRWFCSTETVSAGDISSVVAGTGLTGGATSGAATLNVDVGTGPAQFQTNNAIGHCAANQKLEMSSGPVYTWSCVNEYTPATLADIDGNTKIQLEESANEDKIRFDTAGSERMIIDATGNVGIGTSSPTSALTVSKNTVTLPTPSTNTVLHLAGTDAANSKVTIDAFGAGAVPAIVFRSAQGTAAAPTAVLLNDVLGSVGVSSRKATTYSAGTNASIQFVATENWTDSAVGTGIVFNTKLNGTASGGERMRIDNNGNVGIGTNSPGSPLDVVGAIRADSICDRTGANCKTISGGWGAGGDIDGVTTSTGSGLSGGAATGTAVLQVVVDNSTVEIATNTIQVKDAGITTAKILDGSVTDAKIAAVAVDKITNASGKYFSYMPNAAECADNGVLKWDATNDQWKCGTDLDTNTDAISSIFGRTGTVVAVAGDYTATQITNTASGNISATTAQAAINELDSEKVAKSGDTMTGALTMTNSVMMNAQNEVRLGDSDSSNYAAIRAPATVGTNYILTLPDTDGNSGEVLTTDGAGVLSWTSPATGTGDLLSTNNLSDLTNATTARTNLGLGTMATATATNYVLRDGSLAMTGNLRLNGNYLSGDGGNEGIYVDSSGKVGVGGVPNEPLEVYGSVRSSTGNNLLKMEAKDGSGGYGSRLRFGGSGTNAAVFQIQGLSDTPYLTIGGTAAGNVGIGTTNPAAPLEVVGAIRADSICDRTGANCKTISGGWSPVSSVLGRTGAVVAVAGDYTATQITNTAAGNIAATTAQAAIDELDSEKVAKAGDTMTGALTMANSVMMNAQNEVRLGDSDSSNYAAIRAPAAIGSNYILTLPTTDGNSGEILTTDGAGVLSWTPPTSGDITGVVAGTGLTGGATSGDATLNVDVGTGPAQFQTNDAIGHCAANQKLEMSAGPVYTWSCVNEYTPANLADIDGNTKIQVEESANEDKIRFDTAGTERMIIDDAGKVGIGATSPLTTFQVNSSSTMTGISSWSTASLSSTSGGGLFAASPSVPTAADQRLGVMGFAGYTTDTTPMAGAAVVGWSANAWDATDSSAYLTFETTNGSTSRSEKMRITASGNVGIGTTSPQRRLHVRSDGAYQFRIENGNSGGGFWNIGQSDSGFGTGGGKLLFVPDNDASTAASVVFTNSGNVGIGTTSPGVRLESRSNVSGQPVTTGTTQTNGNFRVSSTATNIAMDMGSDGATSSSWIQSVNRTDLSILTGKLLLNPMGGNVGVGTTTPDREIHISSGSGAQIHLHDTSGATWNGVQLTAGAYNDYFGQNTATGRFFIDTNSDGENLSILQNGNVGIGTTGPSFKLDVASTGSTPAIHGDSPNNYGVYGTSSTSYGVIGASTTGWAIYCNGSSCGGASAWQNSSDERLKKDIHPIDGALDKILRLEGVTYHWRDSQRDKREGQKVGVIAQNVEKVFPQVVKVSKVDKDNLPGGTRTVAYGDLVGPLIQAVKELYYKWSSDHEKLEKLASSVDSKVDKAELEKIKDENRTLKAWICAKDPNASFCR